MILKDNCFICKGNIFKKIACCQVDQKDTGSIDFDINMFQCKKCGLVFADTSHDFFKQDLSKIYDKHYFQRDYMKFYAGDQANQSNEPFPWRLSLIKKYQKPGSILDIGCAGGEFLRLAASQGWQINGIEISAYAADIARSKGVKILGSTIDDLKLISNEFDCISCGDVLEHQIRPDEFLKKVFDLIKPGGIVYIAAPNFNSLHYWLMTRIAAITKKNYFVLPHHLYQFNVRNLKQLVKDQKFLIQKTIKSQSRLQGKGLKRLVFELLFGLARCLSWTDRVIIIAKKP